MKKYFLPLFVGIFLTFSTNFCHAKIRVVYDQFYEKYTVSSQYDQEYIGTRLFKEFWKNGNKVYYMSISTRITGHRGTLTFKPVAQIKFPDGEIIKIFLHSVNTYGETERSRYLAGYYPLPQNLVDKIAESSNISILAEVSNPQVSHSAQIYIPNISPKIYVEWTNIIKAQTPDDPILAKKK